MFIKCPKQGITLLLGFWRVCNALPNFKKNVMEPNVFLGYLERGITNVLNSLAMNNTPPIV